MAWSISLYEWLQHAAMVSLPVFVLGGAAAWCVRQPARRVRIIELTLVAALAAPWLGRIPGYPQWSIAGAAAGRPLPMEPAADAVAAQPERDDTRIAPEPVEFSEASTAQPLAPAAVESNKSARSSAWPAVRDFRPWAAVGYLLGAAALGGWWLAGLAGLVRVRRTARAAPPACRALLIDVAGPAAGCVLLLASIRARQPFTFTWRRPTIVLPQGLVDEADQQALRLCLAHEWSHVRRGDAWSWWLAGAARALFWYQPLVWLLRGQLRLCQDYLADAEAAGQAQAPEDYAQFITSRAFGQPLGPAAAGLGIGGKKSELYRRVIMLVQRRRALEACPPRWWTRGVSVAAVLLLVGLTTFRGITAAAPPVEPVGAGEAEASEKPEVEDVAKQDEPAAQAPAAPAPTKVAKKRLRYGGKSFDQWRDVLLTDLEPATRIKAIEAITTFGAHGYGEEAVGVLGEMLKEDQSSVIQAAAQALRRLDGIGMPKLIEALESSNAEARRRATSALAQMGSAAKASIPALLETVKDPDPEVRSDAAEALVRIGVLDERVSKALGELLHDEEANVRAAVVRTLQDYSRNPDRLAPLLLEALRDDERNIRLWAAEGLARHGPNTDEVVDALMKVLLYEDVVGRTGASLFSNTDPAIAAAIFVEARRKFHAGAASGTLSTEDGNAHHRLHQSAEQLLRHLGPKAKGATPVLIESVKSDDPKIAVESLQVLGSLGPAAKEAIPVLMELVAAEDTPEAVKQVASEALKRIQRNPLESLKRATP